MHTRLGSHCYNIVPIAPIPRSGRVWRQTSGNKILIPARHKTLVHDFKPRMEQHSRLDVPLVHVGFDLGQQVARDAGGLAGKGRPIRVLPKNRSGRLEYVGLGQTRDSLKNRASPFAKAAPSTHIAMSCEFSDSMRRSCGRNSASIAARSNDG